MSAVVNLDGESLTPDKVEAVARDQVRVEVPDSARENVRASREQIETIIDSDEAVYGVNTGFGELVSERISDSDIETLQKNLVRSHSVAVGEEIETDVVRAMMVTRLNTLVKGYSGVREEVIDILVEMLNADIHPVVHKYGSLGASGDLAPLAQLALVAIGEGRVDFKGERISGAEALSRHDIEPLELDAKEGLAMINGTQFTTGLASLLLRDTKRVLKAADVAGAMTTEVTMSTNTYAHPGIQAIRPHDGQAHVAENIRQLTVDSEIIASHRDCDRIQDAYSIRCIPQVHGAIRDAVGHLESVLEVELNSVTDNPLVFPGEDGEVQLDDSGDAVISGGNFHGEPLVLPLDYLVSALTELATISERRVDRILNPNIQENRLPPFLTENGGLESGFMMAQYTAADLVSTMQSEGRPSMTNIPVSGNQEDHVSMSAGSARRVEKVVELAQYVIGIELTCGAEAMEYYDDLEPGNGTKAAYEVIRSTVTPLDDDRALHADIEAVARLIRNGDLIWKVEDVLSGTI